MVINLPLQYSTLSANVYAPPLGQWGFWQCLPFSWTTLGGKHCRHPIAVMGVADTFGQGYIKGSAKCFLSCLQSFTCLLAFTCLLPVFHNKCLD